MLLRRVAKDVTSSLLSWHKRLNFNDFKNPQIFDVIANENALCKRNELDFFVASNSLYKLLCIGKKKANITHIKHRYYLYNMVLHKTIAHNIDIHFMTNTFSSYLA